MTDERLEELLGAWMLSSVPPAPDARASAAAVLERLDDEGTTVAERSWPKPFLQAAASLALLVMVGALLLLAVGGTGPSTDERQPVVVGASVSPSPVPEPTAPEPTTPTGPPIRWQSDEVDLRADSMMLRIGDEVYTGAGADFRVDSENQGNTWSIAPTWYEGGKRHQLTFSFASDTGADWWFPGVRLVTPDVVGRDGSRFSGSVPLEPITRMDVGGGLSTDEPYEGEYSSRGRLELPACGSFGFESLGVALELRGLSVTVSPDEPSAIERIRDDIADAPERLSRLTERDGPTDGRIELDCPPLETVERRVGGLDLAGVPVADGVLRLTGDGIGDYDLPIRDVAVDDAGLVWVAAADGLRRLGSDLRIGTSEVMKHLARIDLASDGTMIIRGGDRKVDKNLVAIREDDGWLVLPDYEIETPGGGPTRDLNDPVIAADGSLYVGVPGGLGRFDGDTWSLVSRRLTSPLATATYTRPFGPTKGLVVTEDGTLWVGIGHTLSEYREGTWIEHEPLTDYLAELFEGAPGDERFATDLMDLGIGRDGTLWAMARTAVEGPSKRGIALLRSDSAGWTVFSLDELAPGLTPEAWNILVDDEGAVLVLLSEPQSDRVPRPDGARLIRFDGQAATELARLPTELGFRLTDVSPDGTVWLIGGYPRERPFDRVHVVMPRAEAAAD